MSRFFPARIRIRVNVSSCLYHKNIGRRFAYFVVVLDTCYVFYLYFAPVL